jgi:hypothetical protein
VAGQVFTSAKHTMLAGAQGLVELGSKVSQTPVVQAALVAQEVAQDGTPEAVTHRYGLQALRLTGTQLLLPSHCSVFTALVVGWSSQKGVFVPQGVASGLGEQEAFPAQVSHSAPQAESQQTFSVAVQIPLRHSEVPAQLTPFGFLGWQTVDSQ